MENYGKTGVLTRRGFGIMTPAELGRRGSTTDGNDGSDYSNE